MAQPAEPIVSVGELPRGAPAHAASCWPMVAMLAALSAEAASGLPRAEATVMAPASAAARRALAKAPPSCVASWTQTNESGDPRWPTGPVANTGGGHGGEKAGQSATLHAPVTASGRCVA